MNDAGWKSACGLCLPAAGVALDRGMSTPENASLIEPLIAACIAAGEAILAVRRSGISVERKTDKSPVTAADRAAEALIKAALDTAAPGVPVVAEEAACEGVIPRVGGDFFLVDPLDGTRDFVRGGDDFTVNIGLMRAFRPSLGVIYVPATGRLFVGAVEEGVAWRASVSDERVGQREPMRVRGDVTGPLDVVASRSHRNVATDECISRFEVNRLVSAGSSLKFCLVACGEADLYPRCGTTMQWDTAAGDAILRAAGGRVVTMEGGDLSYGPNGRQGIAAYENPWFYATGGIDPVGRT
jgi:3'(2'), 5'-bisphosphate nucleotidase